MSLKNKQILTSLATDYFEYLVSIPVEQGGISLEDRPTNIQNLEDVRDSERGLEATQVELEVMLDSANVSQKEICQGVIDELKTNTTAFVSGAAGTGKSYLLKMLERHYKIQGFKARKKLKKRTVPSCSHFVVQK